MLSANGWAKAVAAFCGLVTGLIAVPPPEASAKEPIYYPFTVGDTYVVRGAGHSKGEPEVKFEYSGRVVAVSEGKDGVEVTTEFAGGAESVKGVTTDPATTVRLTDKGIFLLTHGRTTYDPPLMVLPSPFKPGMCWQTPKEASAIDVPVKWTAAKEEEVEVPAGKFKAVRVEGVAERDGVTVRRTEWHAPGVGTVKVVTTGSNGTEIVLELKSFTHGKK